MFAHVSPEDNFACDHESDLQSPSDVLDRLLACPLPSAGWPVITLNGSPQFYDTWAYRDLQGNHFQAETRLLGLTEISSFGSVWMAPADMFRGRVLDEECVVGLCKQWRNEGAKLTVDPSIIIEQPVDLWSPA